MKKSNNREADKMLGTVNNTLRKMPQKDVVARRRRALRQITQREIDMLKKWGVWEDFRNGAIK